MALTLGVGLAGASIFRALGLPVPFMLGPVLACLIAALAGRRLRTWSPLTNAMRTILGVAVGHLSPPRFWGDWAAWPRPLL